MVCREVAKHFQCPFGSGESITPDGAIVLADSTVIALDVTVIGNSDTAKEMIRRKNVGWGSLGALEKARRERANTWERVRRALSMLRRRPISSDPSEVLDAEEDANADDAPLPRADARCCCRCCRSTRRISSVTPQTLTVSVRWPSGPR